MKLKVLTTITFLTALGLITPTVIQAQDPPASTYQPGPWQPVARVNPNSPGKITFVNQTDLTLEYSLTDNQAPPRQLSPDSNAVLNYFSLPAYVVISPLTSSQVSLKYDVAATDNNTITVQIQKISNDMPGDSTFNISSTGAVYIY